MDKLVDRESARVWWLITLSVILFAMDSLGWLMGVRGVVERQLVPLEVGVTKIVEAMSWPVKMAGYYNNGLLRIADLEARLAEKTVDSVRLNKLIEENQAMREMLNVNVNPDWKLVPARVVGRAGEGLVIEAGDNQGLKEGMSVVKDGVLVGRVEKVSVAVSEVLPVISGQSKISARIVGRDVSGILVGDGGKMKLDKVVQGIELEVGDSVETDGLDGMIPGLVVGRVVEIGAGRGEIYREVNVQPLVEVGGGDYVFVIVESE